VWRLLQYKGCYNALVEGCGLAVRDALVARLARLQVSGNQTRYPVTESLGEGLFEVRASAGRVHARLLFGFLSGQRVVFVWGGLKDQRRLSPKDIAKARQLLETVKASEELQRGLVIVH
jgi:hypothetical protein